MTDDTKTEKDAEENALKGRVVPFPTNSTAKRVSFCRQAERVLLRNPDSSSIHVVLAPSGEMRFFGECSVEEMAHIISCLSDALSARLVDISTQFTLEIPEDGPEAF